MKCFLALAAVLFSISAQATDGYYSGVPTYRFSKWLLANTTADQKAEIVKTCQQDLNGERSRISNGQLSILREEPCVVRPASETGTGTENVVGTIYFIR